MINDLELKEEESKAVSFNWFPKQVFSLELLYFRLMLAALSKTEVYLCRKLIDLMKSDSFFSCRDGGHSASCLKEKLKIIILERFWGMAHAAFKD